MWMKIRMHCLIWVQLMICIGLILYTNFYITHTTSTVVVNYGQYVFQEYKGQNVFTLQDVCVEKNPFKRSNGDRRDRIIVIYNADHDSEKTELLAVRKHASSASKGWPVIYRTGPVPKQYAIMNHPAFFMDTTCEGNLHHFTTDSLMSLYSYLSITDRLNKSRRSQVFTPVCMDIKNNSCHSLGRYSDLALHLGVIPESYGCIHDMPPDNGTCYKHAGFGFMAGADPRKFYQYLTSQYGLTEGSCTSSRILFVRRSNRRILNLEELYQATVALALPNTTVEVVRLEEMSVEQQVRTVYCSRVMVGVQGAGLQWIYFLQPQAAILEIGWKRWPSKYVIRGNLVGVRGSFIDATQNITVVWDLYKKANKIGNLTEKEQQEKLNDNNLLYDANPYKWADVTIEGKVFLRHLKQLINDLRNDGVEF